MGKLWIPVAAVSALLLVGGSGMWVAGGRKPGDLTWDIVAKKSVMSVAYKAYANAAAGNGRYYLSKTVFRNRGEGSVHDVAISYQIPDYVSWTTPDKFPEILPGQTVVDVYYPTLPQRVAEFTSAQPSTLEVKISWDDGSGKPREEIQKVKFEFRGVNEMEYTTLAATEIASWFDLFENSDLVAAFVTTDDPVVKAFAGEVTRFAGGTTAGAGGSTNEVAATMEALYNYQLALNMHYASARGFPAELGDIKTLVQDIRLPREVILNGHGLCIETAILWCTVMGHLGVKTLLVMVPGHAFTVVVDNSGNWIPIETTGIGGERIGRMGFRESLETAQKELQNAMNQGVYQLIDVAALQAGGIRPPELPKIETRSVQETLAKRLEASRPAQQQPDVPQEQPQNDQTQATAFRQWSHPDGICSFSYPREWQTNAQAIQQIQQAGVDWFLFAAEDGSTAAEVDFYHFKDAADVEAALTVMQDFMERAQGTMDVRASMEVNVGGRRGQRLSGVTTWQNGSENAWMMTMVATKRGVVAVSAASPLQSFDNHKALLDKIVQSLKVK